MNGNSVDVGVVDEPDDLIGEKLSVVLRVEVGFGGLGRVQLQALSDALSEDIKRGVGLHDLVHGLLDELLRTEEEVTEATVQIVSEVYAQETTCRRGVDRHVVSRVVQKLGSAVALDVVRVVVTPSQLHIYPVLSGSVSIVGILLFVEK